MKLNTQIALSALILGSSALPTGLDNSNGKLAATNSPEAPSQPVVIPDSTHNESAASAVAPSEPVVSTPSEATEAPEEDSQVELIARAGGMDMGSLMSMLGSAGGEGGGGGGEMSTIMSMLQMMMGGA